MFGVDLCCVLATVSGYRSIKLLSDHSEELEIASLLIRINISNPKVKLHAVVNSYDKVVH